MTKRSIEDITDEEIIEAIAVTHGVSGEGYYTRPNCKQVAQTLGVDYFDAISERYASPFKVRMSRMHAAKVIFACPCGCEAHVISRITPG